MRTNWKRFGQHSAQDGPDATCVTNKTMHYFVELKFKVSEYELDKNGRLEHHI